MNKTSYSVKLTPEQKTKLEQLLRTGNYRPKEVPYTSIAVEANDCRVNVYQSGKCLVQGKGTEDFVQFVLEPEILLEASLGYEDVLNPESTQPHCGVDESGKGDFFGPMVIAAVYIDPVLAEEYKKIGVRDSKMIKSAKVASDMARAIRSASGGRYALVTIGPQAYNKLYATMKNVNRILAWGHARAIENLLERVPDCPRALSDQFGPTRQIERALLQKGRKIVLQQMPKAESDPAVAAASILARDAFVQSLTAMGKKFNTTIPKGASALVKNAAAELVSKNGPEILLQLAKCHFRTTDEVLARNGHTRTDLGAQGQATSKSIEQKK